MKKTIAILTAAVLLISLMAVPAMAHKDNASYGDVPKSADPIVLDAQKDAVYDKGLKLDITRKYEPYDWSPDTTSTGAAWILWQDGFLYLYAEINKAIGALLPQGDYADQSGQPWMTDSLEIFLDWPNDSEGGEFDQYRIDAYGYRSFQNNFTGENSYGDEEKASDGIFEGKAKIIDNNNYAVEFKIPLQTNPGSIGFLLQINEMWDESTRSVVFSGSSTGNANSWVPIECDFIVLASTEVTAVVAVEEPAPAEPEPAAPPPAEEAPAEAPPPPVVSTPPQTGDTAVIIFAALILTAAAGMVVFKKRTQK
ncbi:MAG: NPXTG-anchored protein [Oscillospiraceae bacterium]|nr:NPXTG-anchored protein [Oscillospiraceae bacterium]